VEKTGGREITSCKDADVENRYPYVATKAAIKDKSKAVAAVVKAVADNIAWIQANPDEQARLLAPKLGFSETAITTTYARGAKALQPADAAFYASEQPVIDELVQAKIVARPVKASDVFIAQFNADTTAGPAGS
jgi:sulfonate transport system substrate-binding protein